MNDNKDTITVALTIFASSKNATQEWREAVASVIWTHAKGKTRGLAKACVEHFDCWKQGKPPKANNDSVSRRSWKACFALAERVVRGKFVPTFKATHIGMPKGGNGRIVRTVLGTPFCLLLREKGKPKPESKVSIAIPDARFEEAQARHAYMERMDAACKKRARMLMVTTNPRKFCESFSMGELLGINDLFKKGRRV
jgi:hypothetical protein